MDLTSPRTNNKRTKVVKEIVNDIGLNKERQSCADREKTKAIKDATAGHQLVLARLSTEQQDPNKPAASIITIKLPETCPVFLDVLDTNKISKAVRLTQERFTCHLAEHRLP
jgi:hypothetical protein